MAYIMNLNTRLGLIFGILLLNQPLWAGSCNMGQIDQFLQRGFTHEQVVKLCGNPQTSEPSPSQKDPESAPTQEPATQPNSGIEKDTFYLHTVIDADKVEVTPEAIIYWRDKCYAYGSEGFTGFRPEAR